MTQTTLKIDGMMCGMCESHINDAIRKEFPVKMLIYGKEATTQIENSVPYYSVSKWSSNTKMLLLHFHAP